MCVPNVNDFYDNVKKALKKYNIITIPKIPNKLSNIVIKAKDRLSKENQTNVVYKIECASCNVSYVGESKRESIERIHEHRRPVDAIIKAQEVAENKNTLKNLSDKNSHIIITRSKNKKQATNNESIALPVNNTATKKNNVKVITEHHKKTGHTFAWKDYKILDREPNFHKRRTSEALYINLQLNPINEKEDSQNLYKPYLCSIHKMKRNINHQM